MLFITKVNKSIVHDGTFDGFFYFTGWTERVISYFLAASWLSAFISITLDNHLKKASRSKYRHSMDKGVNPSGKDLNQEDFSNHLCSCSPEKRAYPLILQAQLVSLVIHNLDKAPVKKVGEQHG